MADKDLIIKDVRAAFVEVFHATEFKEGDGKPRWNITALVEPGSANDKAIWATIDAVGAETFKDKWPKVKEQIKTNGQKFCYVPGDLKDYDGFAGMMALSCHRAAKLKSGAANARPAIIDRDKSPLTAEDGKPYSGCFVNLKVNIWAQTGEFPGIRASFSVVQFVRDGEAFSAGAPNTDAFESLAEGADAGELI